MLRVDRLKDDENVRYPLYYQCTLDGKVAKGMMGVMLLEAEWDSVNQRVLPCHLCASKLNKMLDRKRCEMESAVLDYLDSGKRITIDVLRAIVQGKYDPNKKPEHDFVDYVKANLKTRYQEQRIGYSTYFNGKCYMNLFTTFLKEVFFVTKVNLSEVTLDMVDKYILWRKNVRHNKNETVNKALTPIIKACEDAATDDLFKRSLAEKIAKKYLPVEKPSLEEDEEDDDDHSDHYLTEDQLRKLANMYDQCQFPRTKDFIDMFFFSFYAWGLRVSDILTLKWSQINFSRREIRKVLVKGRKRHRIYLSDEAIAILNSWYPRTGQRKFVFNVLDDDFDLEDDELVRDVVQNKNRTISQSLLTLGKKLGLPFNLGMHCARHSFAVYMLNIRKMDIHLVSKMLAHSTIEVTAKVYAKWMPETMDKLSATNFHVGILPGEDNPIPDVEFENPIIEMHPKEKPSFEEDSANEMEQDENLEKTQISAAILPRWGTS